MKNVNLMKYKNELKNNNFKGITLIALVITIIVILILAGATISAITGNENAIQKAKEAQIKNNIATAKDEATMLNSKYIQEYLEKRYIQNLEVEITSSSIINEKFKVGENGDNIYSISGIELPRLFAGTSTEKLPATIKEYVIIQFNERATNEGSYNYRVEEDDKLKIADKTSNELITEAIILDNGSIQWIASESKETLVGKVNLGDYIIYDPTYGVTDNSKLEYTSHVGELKVKDSNGNYVVNETGINVYEYNGAYRLIDQNGKFDFTNYTVESDVNGNGYGEQKFKATAEKNLWRVVDDGKTTGVIKIAPEKLVRTTTDNYYSLKGMRGYKNAVTELNKICEIFGHGLGAQSSECYNNTITLPFEYLREGSDYLMDYFWYSRTYVADEEGIHEENGLNYYISARFGYQLGIESSSGYFDWNFAYAHYKDGREVAMTAADYDGDKTSVLPIVSLISNVEYKDGDGSKENPWIFQQKPQEEYYEEEYYDGE